MARFDIIFNPFLMLRPSVNIYAPIVGPLEFLGKIDSSGLFLLLIENMHINYYMQAYLILFSSLASFDRLLW